jgi:hypothetical protein
MINLRPLERPAPGIVGPTIDEACPFGIFQQVSKSCRDVLVPPKEMIVEAPLPQVIDTVATEKTSGSAFENPHDIQQRALEVEEEKVDMVGHDAIPEGS